MSTNFKPGDWIASIQNIGGTDVITHICLVDRVTDDVVGFTVLIDITKANITALDHLNDYVVPIDCSWYPTLHKIPDELVHICEELLEINRIELIDNAVASKIKVDNFKLVPGFLFRFK